MFKAKLYPPGRLLGVFVQLKCQGICSTGVVHYVTAYNISLIFRCTEANDKGLCCKVWEESLGLIVYLTQFLLSNDNETTHLDIVVSERNKKFNNLNNNNKKPLCLYELDFITHVIVLKELYSRSINRRTLRA